MSWFVKPYSRGQLTREERIANYRISRGRKVVENVFGILVSRFRVPQGTMEQRPKVVRNTVLTWVALHNMLRTHQDRTDRVPTPADDIAALQNEQVVHVLNDNFLPTFFKSNTFPTSFQTISNKITSHAMLLNNFNRSKHAPQLS